ncbi:MAG TPA: metalloregulator ArsR/SmtB family transcription factor [Acidimicrobiales bacterium]|jgi:DNA-binding transcriptional ArsR family regulator
MTTQASGAQQVAPRPDVQATPSLATDLIWALSVAVNQSTPEKQRMRAELFAGREELAGRVRAFWGDNAVDDACFTEMHVIAHHAGAISETDPDALWAAIEEGAQTVPLDLPLESEDPDYRLRFLARMEKLQNSPDLRRRYIALLKEVWEPINERWQASLPILYETGRHAVEQIERRPFHEVVRVDCNTFHSRIPIITAQLETGAHTLLVVPCLFFGCSLYLEFPGMTLLGMGVDQHGAVARARTESVARRLKTVADPTRLALLHFLATRPSSVSDLASSFGLAQPTVSMHVKLLREAGLVRAERQSGRLQLSADPGAVDLLLNDLRGCVARPADELTAVG